MHTLADKAFQGLGGLLAAMAVILFGLPWTLDFWQAWLFLGIYGVTSAAITVRLLQKDPDLLRRRLRAGPLAEKEPAQQIIMLFASLGFAGLLIVPAVDRRFDWSQMSPAVAIAGDLLVILGWSAIYRVFRENSYSSATIEVASDQTVICTGPYAVIRHPMYAASLVMLLGIPLSLASWWGLLPFAVIAAALVVRILDEERFLTRSLRGYTDYKQKVRYRLIPHLW